MRAVHASQSLNQVSKRVIYRPTRDVIGYALEKWFQSYAQRTIIELSDTFGHIDPSQHRKLSPSNTAYLLQDRTWKGRPSFLPQLVLNREHLLMAKPVHLSPIPVCTISCYTVQSCVHNCTQSTCSNHGSLFTSRVHTCLSHGCVPGPNRS